MKIVHRLKLRLLKYEDALKKIEHMAREQSGSFDTIARLAADALDKTKDVK